MISIVLTTLYADHVNLSRLFLVIEDEIERIRADQLDVDVDTLTLALEYCACYPSHFHHPTEDLMYDMLIRRTPELKGEIAAITADHKTLSQLTETFSNAVASATVSGGTKLVHTLGLEFLRQYRRHMHIENTKLFPAAEKNLTQWDWSEIEKLANPPVDSLFNEHVREAYLALNRRIVTRA